MQGGENLARKSMSFVEQFELIQQYSQLTGLEPQEAGPKLGFEQATTSKLVKCYERVSDENKKKLSEAGVGFTIVYELSQAKEPLQSELVDKVINARWTRKQLTEALKPVKQGFRRFEFRRPLLGELIINIPRDAGVEKLRELTKEFEAELKRCLSYNDDPAWVASTLKGKAHA